MLPIWALQEVPARRKEPQRLTKHASRPDDVASLLQLLTVGMVSVLKNITNLFTIFGDIAFYGKSYGTGAPSLSSSNKAEVACVELSSFLTPSLATNLYHKGY